MWTPPQNLSALNAVNIVDSVIDFDPNLVNNDHSSNFKPYLPTVSPVDKHAVYNFRMPASVGGTHSYRTFAFGMLFAPPDVEPQNETFTVSGSIAGIRQKNICVPFVGTLTATPISSKVAPQNTLLSQILLPTDSASQSPMGFQASVNHTLNIRREADEYLIFGWAMENIESTNELMAFNATLAVHQYYERLATLDNRL